MPLSTTPETAITMQEAVVSYTKKNPLVAIAIAAALLFAIIHFTKNV